MQTDSDQTGPSCFRLRTAAKFIVLTTMTVAAFVWFGVPPVTNTQPVSLQKNSEGRLQQIDSNGEAGGLNLEAHAGSLQSSNGISSSTATSHSSPGFFAERSMMILNRSDHLLMQRVGDGLIEYLQDQSHLDRIDYFPTGHGPAVGDRAPDLFVMLDLGAIEESGIVGRDLDATVTLTLGSALTKSNHSVVNSYSPPTLDLSAQFTIEHASSLTGVESSAARYRLQGNNIAQEVGKAILEKLESLLEEHKALPKLPESFYPTWIATPEFAFLADQEATLLTSMRGLCCHNESLWVVPNVKDAAALLEQVHSELTALNWKGRSGEFKHGTINMRMNNGPKALEVFHVPHRHGKHVLTDANATDNSGIHVYVRFRHSMTQEERNDAYGQMLASATPNFEQLASLRPMGSHKQRQQFIEMIQDSPPQSIEAWMMLAEHYSAEKKIPELQQALKAVYVLSWCQNHTGRMDGRIRQLRKKHKLDTTSVRDVNFVQLQALGLPSVTKESPVWEQIIQEGESATTFVRDGDNWQLVSVTLHRIQQQSQDDVLFDTTIAQGNPSSRSSTHGVQRFQPPEERNITLKQSHATLFIESQGSNALHLRLEITPE
ncbi:MAG: hypothetical protein GY903_23610 [Fuerstiella sp.]|nr:hypothetical protein [Fuerstiella sp.]MCP4857482.1 hypothetical protein [Fuerstiella sp.]